MPGIRVCASDNDKLHNKYFCRLCELVLRDPVQTECGHLFCRSCCFDSSTTDVCCVEDGKVILGDRTFRDRLMEREVLCLVVGCTYQDEGCSWKGMIRNLEDHERNDCEFLEVPCVYEACGLLVKRGELADHLKVDCICRPEKCRICGKSVNHNMMKKHHRVAHNHLHYEVDNLRDVVDDLLYSQYHLRDEQRHLQDGQHHLQEGQHHLQEGQRNLQDEQRRLHLVVRELQERLLVAEKGNPHQRQDDIHNAVRVVKDTLAEITGSSDEQAIRADPLHLLNIKRRIESIDHTLVMRNATLADSEEFVRQQAFSSYDGQPLAGETRNLHETCQERSARITVLEGNVALGNLSGACPSAQMPSESSGGAQGRVINVENNTACHEVLVVRNNCTVEEARPNMVDTNRKRSKRHDRRIESIEHTLALKVTQQANLEEYVRQQEFSSCDGLLLWKISDYARRRNDAVTGRELFFNSPCFYTSRYGYKMCARIYLNGDGMGRGTHISLLFVVMRGQYDALLRWPFRHKVTFMLLDQDNVEHVIDAFRPDPSSSSFQRPKSDMNIASGCPMFCSQAELNNHAYVRDDTMFLKIIVDTSDL